MIVYKKSRTFVHNKDNNQKHQQTAISNDYNQVMLYSIPVVWYSNFAFHKGIMSLPIY